MYPFYDKAVKAGINIICIHKGLLPADYEKAFAGVWEYATAWDIGKAAKDWPQMTFVIYHSALRAFLELPEQGLGRSSRPPAASSGRPTSPRSRRSSASTTSTPSSAPASPTPQSRIPGSLRPGRHAGQGLGAGQVCSGAPTPCGTDRRNGRSRRCGAWRSPRTCRRSTASRLSATPTARQADDLRQQRGAPLPPPAPGGREQRRCRPIRRTGSPS